MTKKVLTLIAFLVACPMLVTEIFAQGPPPPEPIPIDGGVSLLAAAAIGYGVKKIYDNRKKKSE